MSECCDVNDIGRLFMVGVRGSEAGDPELEADLDACADVGIKGVVLFDLDVVTGQARNVRSKRQLIKLIAHIRARLGTNTKIGVDQEGGRVVRFREEHGFTPLPSAQDFAKMPIVHQRSTAQTMAQELAEVGIDINFAPCVDLDGPCPVIGELGRSFSEDPLSVSDCAAIVVEELERAGVASCLKHFPGHGSAHTDSHHELPDITTTHHESQELMPYKDLFARRTSPSAVMTGHLLHKELDPTYPASVSRRITTGLLREQLDFRGMIVTDSLDMQALRASLSLEEAAAIAIVAGANIVLHACNSPLGETANDVARAAKAIADQSDDVFKRARKVAEALRSGCILSDRER